jgi:dTDP-4-amino-4,6-dideoxygalactose transaminase
VSNSYPELSIPLAQPPLPQEVVHDLQQVVRSGRLVSGPHTQVFEKSVAQRAGVPHAIATASGTLAEWVLLKALKIPHGARVAVPAFTFIGVANAVVFAGGVPVPIDVRSSDLAMDPAEFKRATEAQDLWGAIVVDPFGFAVDFEAYENLCSEHSLVLMEDAACALGSQSASGRWAGSRGEGAIFSFHPRKVVTTGEGGMITTSDDALAHAVRKLTNHGKNPKSGLFDEPGFNARLSELSSVCGRASLAHLNQEVEARTRHLRRYEDALRSEEDEGTIRLIRPPTGSKWNVQTLVLELCDTTTSTEKLCAEARAQGIELGGTAQCWPGSGAYPALESDDFPVAARLEKRTLSLPIYDGLEPEDVQKVCSVIINTLVQSRTTSSQADTVNP